MMDSQNINSFISNFNYTSTPDNLGQTFYTEESSIEQRSFTSGADPVNMQSNRLVGLPGWTMKGKGLDSPRWLSTVSITAIIDLLLESYPNFFSSNRFIMLTLSQGSSFCLQVQGSGARLGQRRAARGGQPFLIVSFHPNP